MGTRRDWSKIGQVVAKIQELGLTYREGAKRFGVKAHDLYCYNHRVKRQGADVNGKQTEGNGSGRPARQANPRDGGVQLPEEL
jgi:transposase